MVLNTSLSKSRKLLCQKLHNYLVCIHAAPYACRNTDRSIHTAISKKVVGKSERNNPERYCGWF